jgi:hypothetical protein
MLKNVNDKLVDQFVSESNWEAVGLTAPKKGQSKSTEVNESKDTEDKFEKHVCPLCESELNEEISDEKLLEHSQEILAVFEAVDEAVQELINESEEDGSGDEDEDEDSYDEDDEAESEDDEDSEDEEVEDEE